MVCKNIRDTPWSPANLVWWHKRVDGSALYSQGLPAAITKPYMLTLMTALGPGTYLNPLLGGWSIGQGLMTMRLGDHKNLHITSGLPQVAGNLATCNHASLMKWIPRWHGRQPYLRSLPAVATTQAKPHHQAQLSWHLHFSTWPHVWVGLGCSN